MTTIVEPTAKPGTTTAKPPRKRKRTARRPREFTTFDVWVLVGSIVSAACLNWLIFYRLTAGASLFAEAHYGPATVTVPAYVDALLKAI